MKVLLLCPQDARDFDCIAETKAAIKAAGHTLVEVSTSEGLAVGSLPEIMSSYSYKSNEFADLLEALRGSDVLVYIPGVYTDNGFIPDATEALQMGYALALDKKVVIFAEEDTEVPGGLIYSATPWYSTSAADLIETIAAIQEEANNG